MPRYTASERAKGSRATGTANSAQRGTGRKGSRATGTSKSAKRNTTSGRRVGRNTSPGTPRKVGRK